MIVTRLLEIAYHSPGGELGVGANDTVRGCIWGAFVYIYIERQVVNTRETGKRVLAFLKSEIIVNRLFFQTILTIFLFSILKCSVAYTYSNAHAHYTDTFFWFASHLTYYFCTEKKVQVVSFCFVDGEEDGEDRYSKRECVHVRGGPHTALARLEQYEDYTVYYIVQSRRGFQQRFYIYIHGDVVLQTHIHLNQLKHMLFNVCDFFLVVVWLV